MTYKLPEPAYPLGRGDLPSFSAEQVDAAYAAGLAARVPEGWKLVPIEPTELMCAEGLEDEESTIKDGKLFARGLYAAMLAAAPEPKP